MKKLKGAVLKILHFFEQKKLRLIDYIRRSSETKNRIEA